ncbi:hypothetical protein GRF59_23260 [Paenibacillus sp. HJL G12]|uniref:Uncharacterized protein n=1 Tax=Paenibacillus dendrobii TaxID=2691084 RepID=A0A7X3IM73_9BACL|nr:hypothetical protein [Paenibacillus dendrobii]MWV46529.1 hypothetical protein [Paenibacillus dendrobii]
MLYLKKSALSGRADDFHTGYLLDRMACEKGHPAESLNNPVITGIFKGNTLIQNRYRVGQKTAIVSFY